MQAALRRQLQAGAVAGGQLLPVPLGHPPPDDGPHRVEHVPGREVIAPGKLGPAVGLRAALGLHEAEALVPELEARRRVDGVVDAPVAGVKAPQQGGVGRVDDGVRPQPGDVPLPEDQAWVGLGGDQGLPVHHPLLRRLGGEKGVLGRQKVRVQGHGRP